jgi:hypothetical protein
MTASLSRLESLIVGQFPCIVRPVTLTRSRPAVAASSPLPQLPELAARAKVDPMVKSPPGFGLAGKCSRVGQRGHFIWTRGGVFATLPPLWRHPSDFRLLAAF